VCVWDLLLTSYFHEAKERRKGWVETYNGGLCFVKVVVVEE
jgi:hypothetical protein